MSPQFEDPAETAKWERLKTPAERKPVSDVSKQLGKRVAYRRDMLGLTQQELADATGLTRSSIANIESGRQEMGLAVVVAMAAKLHTTVGALLDESLLTPIPGTTISLGWRVACDKCGPVGFTAEHEDARELRTTHLAQVHLAAS